MSKFPLSKADKEVLIFNCQTQTPSFFISFIIFLYEQVYILINMRGEEVKTGSAMIIIL